MQAGKNDIIIFLLVVTVIVLLLTGLIITLIYLYQKKQLAYQRNLEFLKLDHEKNLMAAQLEMQEDTFQHISKEIHDNISLSLTLAKLNLNTLDWDEKEKTVMQVNSVIDLISESISNLSDISKSLNSDLISSQGLITAIKNEITRIRETGLFSIDINITGEPVYMDVKKELIIFRIVQESFNNIIKHAAASLVQLTLCYSPKNLQLAISDNGRGFITIDYTVSGKAGLKNMETRVCMLDGEMRVESIVGKGTLLSFIFPY
jgi:two-component system, NarL family, sensor kinase